ncbi:MAG: recombination-associated protein RdgC [Desulfobacterales bacterium]|nr:MAG: recombination-associated protein RdgC [Desulfobacterales bacterium]
MGILSASNSITRYHVEGRLESPVLDNILRGLKKNTITEIEGDASEKMVGWTSFDKPYQPNFDGSSFVFGSHLVFSLRIDKKNIPAKVLKKHYMLETAKRLAESGREYLSRHEKKMLKDHVINVLNLRIPAVPNVYDVIWKYEESILWFFSNLKAANEELETLFSNSFNLTLIRLFPYTSADLVSGLSDAERDDLLNLSPTKFAG